MSRFKASYALLMLSIILFALIAFLATREDNITLVDTREGASVLFESDKQQVLLPGDCVTLTWQLEGISRVFLNDVGVTGIEERLYCDTGIPANLTVEFQNGDVMDYAIHINTLATPPLSYILLIAIVTLLASSYRFLNAFFVRISLYDGLKTALLPMFIMTLIVFVIAEVGLRGYLGAFGTQLQKVMYLYSVEEVRNLQQRVLHLPYVSYVPHPDYEGHNALGYRNAEIELPKPVGIYRIVAMGGSTTYSSGTIASESYPTLLQTMLREEYGYSSVEVINAGMLGYTSWEQLPNFAFRILELEPDMIIYYEAVNDLVVREQSSIDCYRGNNPIRGLNPHRGLFVERQASYPPSVAYRFMAVSLGWMANPANLDSAFEPVAVDCDPDEADLSLEARLSANTPDYYYRNLFNIIALARANEVQPVLSSWAYYIDGNRPELWRAGIAEHNLIIRQLADELDVPYYDLFGSFPVDASLWEVDGVHMITAGTLEQARQYAEFLHESNLLPR